MCKLFAYINNEPKTVPFSVSTKINKVLDHLFYINSYKQVDGSGLMWMDFNGNTDYIKNSLTSTIFTQTNDYRSVQNTLANNRFVAGHTRFSTVGSNNWENSHPFDLPTYLGMQNGTARCAHRNLVYGKVSPYNVDSASVFWSFEEQGTAATFDSYMGEGVFLFFNKENKTFNIVKNDKRTLYIAEIVESNGYIIATEADAIKLTCKRANLSIKEPVPVENDTLITYTIDCTVTKRDLTVKTPIPATTYPTKDYNYGRDNKPGVTNNKVAKFPVPSKSTPSYNPPTTYDSYEDYYAYYEKLFDVSSDYVGDCAVCGDPIMSTELFYGDTPAFASSRVFCCDSCVDIHEQMTGKIMYEIDMSKETINA